VGVGVEPALKTVMDRFEGTALRVLPEIQVVATCEDNFCHGFTTSGQLIEYTCKADAKSTRRKAGLQIAHVWFEGIISQEVVQSPALASEWPEAALQLGRTCCHTRASATFLLLDCDGFHRLLVGCWNLGAHPPTETSDIAVAHLCFGFKCWYMRWNHALGVLANSKCSRPCRMWSGYSAGLNKAQRLFTNLTTLASKPLETMVCQKESGQNHAMARDMPVGSTKMSYKKEKVVIGV
jgi:hypothetical protein